MESKKLAKPRKNGAFSTRQGVMLLTNSSTIREVILFPTMKPID